MLALERINLQYWFNGPQNTPDTSDALSLFTMDCLDTSLGALSCFNTLYVTCGDRMTVA